MARLNGYLYQIRAAPTDECPCGQAKETVEHFLCRCVNGQHNVKRCFSVRMRNAATSPFTREARRHQMDRNGHQTWTQCGPQSGSRSLQVNPSSPGDFHALVAITFSSTSSSLNSGIATYRSAGRSPSSSITADRGGKKTPRSSSACSALSLAVVPSLLFR
jgi:hypothetical protein